MQYGEGNEQRAREDAVRERMQKWARWLKEKPDEAADWLKHIDHNGSLPIFPASECRFTCRRHATTHHNV